MKKGILVFSAVAVLVLAVGATYIVKRQRAAREAEFAAVQAAQQAAEAAKPNH